MNRTVECIYDEKPKSRNQLLREKLLLLEEHVRMLESYEGRHPPDLAPSSPSWRSAAMHSPTGAMPDDYVAGFSCIFSSKSRWLRRTPQAVDSIDSIKLSESPPDSPEMSYAWHSSENFPVYIQELPEFSSYPLDPSPFSVWHILHDLPESVLQETSSFLSVWSFLINWCSLKDNVGLNDLLNTVNIVGSTLMCRDFRSHCNHMEPRTTVLTPRSSTPFSSWHATFLVLHFAPS